MNINIIREHKAMINLLITKKLLFFTAFIARVRSVMDKIREDLKAHLLKS